MSKIARKRWSHSDDEYLIENYHRGDENEIISHLGRSWDAIKLRARKLNQNRWAGFCRSNDLSILLNETLETYYWIGFLLADGHIHNNTRLAFTLSIKDLDHLKTFSEYISCRTMKNDSNKCWLKAQDIDSIPILSSKFQIDTRKTYNPPIFSSYVASDDLIFALLVGFYDGDGSTRQRKNGGNYGSIKVHSNWMENISFMCDFLNNRYKIKSIQKPKIDKEGYCIWYLTQELLQNMKIDINRLSLPVLQRKWNIKSK